MAGRPYSTVQYSAVFCSAFAVPLFRTRNTMQSKVLLASHQSRYSSTHRSRSPSHSLLDRFLSQVLMQKMTALTFGTRISAFEGVLFTPLK